MIEKDYRILLVPNEKIKLLVNHIFTKELREHISYKKVLIIQLIISGNVKIGRNCFFAINSTVSHSVTIGKECFIGANVLIAKCTKDLEVYIFESTKPFRLNYKQFIRMTNFDII